MWAFGFFGFAGAWRRESLSGLATKACLAGVVVGILALPASASALTDFTWSGADTVGNSNWSDATNWGGTAPSGSVGTLTFPALTSAACTANPPTDACYKSNNDLTGLSTTGISIHGGYDIGGNGITLGSGGITADGESQGGLYVPVTLSANQTWSIARGGLAIGKVTGRTDTVAIHFPSRSNADLTLDGFADVEVGAVTVTGESAIELDPYVFSGGLKPPASLNGTDGNPVTITGGGSLLVGAPGSEVGPLTTDGNTVDGNAIIDVGTGVPPAGTLAVDGGLTLDSTILVMFIDHAGTTPSTDYSQVTASGTVSLANDRLVLDGALVAGGGDRCPRLNVGDVYKLITTSGSLTGTFSGMPNGTAVRQDCGPGTPPTLEINYTASAVTATVLTAGSSATPTSTILAALSERAFSPHGKNATIIALLKHGGFTYQLGESPAAGTMVINWYFLPKGAHLTKARKAKPVRIASGRAGLTTTANWKITVRLTANGKHLLRHAKVLKVTSKSTLTPTVGRAASKLNRFTLRR